ncbi:tRNA modification GTPase [bacterium]|nr:tRNA modification GTPase [bacterium]
MSRERVEKTIVAVATPPGEGGLAVVRLSGPDAFAIADKVFSGPGFGPQPTPRRAVYGILKSPTESGTAISEIDQAIALPFVAPHSATGEDVVEFFCHGGRVVAGMVVAACRVAGAEPATAGEFTRRAFLNGKLSLDQAEAVADLIHAPSDHAARAAVRQLLGGFDDQLAAVEGPLLDLLARLEGGLEFSDDEDMGVGADTVRRVLDTSIAGLGRLVAMAPAGRLLRDGVHVVLAGPPNVGKSSLFNALLAEERAIVDAEAGTTRDVISARRHRDGTVWVLHDTAGLRSDGGRVEGLGMERARRQVAEADVVLALAVAGEAPTELVVPDGTPVLRVWTKGDLAPGFAAPAGEPIVASPDGSGIASVWAELDAVVAGFRLEEAIALGVVLNERHLHKLGACRDDLVRLRDEVAATAPGDEIVGSLLAPILGHLGEVSGRVFSEQVLESVFKRFCVGK